MMSEFAAAQMSKDFRQNAKKRLTSLKQCGAKNLHYFGGHYGLRERAADPRFACGLFKYLANEIQNATVLAEIMQLGESETATPRTYKSDTFDQPEVLIRVLNDPSISVHFAGLGLRQTTRKDVVEFRGRIAPESVRALVAEHGGALTIIADLQKPPTMSEPMNGIVDETATTKDVESPQTPENASPMDPATEDMKSSQSADVTVIVNSLAEASASQPLPLDEPLAPNETHQELAREQTDESGVVMQMPEAFEKTGAATLMTTSDAVAEGSRDLALASVGSPEADARKKPRISSPPSRRPMIGSGHRPRETSEVAKSDA